MATTCLPRAFHALEPGQLRLDRCDGRGLRSQLPVERDGADEDAQADIIERLAELGRHGRCQLLGVRQHAADRRPKVVGPVHREPRVTPSGVIVAVLRGSCNRDHVVLLDWPSDPNYT